MKTNKIIALTLVCLLHIAPAQAMAKKVVIGTVGSTLAYAGYIGIKADGNPRKLERLHRQNKDKLCKTVRTALEGYNDSHLFDSTITTIKDLESTEAQKWHDYLAEIALEPSTKVIDDTYQFIEDAIKQAKRNKELNGGKLTRKEEEQIRENLKIAKDLSTQVKNGLYTDLLDLLKETPKK